MMLSWVARAAVGGGGGGSARAAAAAAAVRALQSQAWHLADSSSGSGSSGSCSTAAQQTNAFDAWPRRQLHSSGAPHAAVGAAAAHATTILCVRHGGEVVMMGDGQATQDAFIVKRNVRKVRRLAGGGGGSSGGGSSGGGGVIAGFAGRAADGLSLLERLEAKLAAHPGQLRRAAVELAKDWRQDRVLRHLDALLLVADARTLLWLSGNGDVIESPDGVMAIGSGGDYAEAAARALLPLPDQTAMGVAHRAMRIAADCCVYTNHAFTWQKIAADGRLTNGHADEESVTESADATDDAAAG